MKLEFDYDFLLLEFKDLHHSIKRVEEEEDFKLLCSRLVKVIQHIIITIYLGNNIFYHSEISLVENIKDLWDKHNIHRELMQKLSIFVREIELFSRKVSNEDKDISTIEKEIIYELLVCLVSVYGEENYSLFSNKLKTKEREIFNLYLKEGKNSEIASRIYDENEELEYLEQEGVTQGKIELEDENLLVGEIFYLGKGVDKDYFKAREYFEISAKDGNEQAEGYLGLFYEKGYGGEKDIEKALYWYRKSALKGNIFAQYSLGYIYFAGEEVKQNMEYSFQWYKEAAENNFAPAQYALSYLYKNGEGCEKSIVKAYYWLEKSAENNFEEAYYILGQSYLEGNYIETDYKKHLNIYGKDMKKVI